MKEGTNINTSLEFIWGEDNRFYARNFITDEKRLVTDPKLLIKELVLLKKNDTPNKDHLAKISYLWTQLPPLYTQEEVNLLEALMGNTPNIIQYWEELDLFEVEEPKRIDFDKLKSHPFNSEIYGDEDVTELAKQIKSSGWIKPITINLKGEVLGGHRRRLARNLLKEQGHIISSIEIDIKRFHSTEDELQFLLLDNSYRRKTQLQILREGQYYKMLHSIASSKKKSNLSDSEQSFLSLWDSTKTEILQKKTKKVKTRDVLGALLQMSGDQVRKGLLILWLIDFYTETNRTQEKAELIDLLENKSLTAAYNYYLQWQQDNPTDHIYIGEKDGTLSPNDKVELIHAAKDSDPNYCYVRLKSGGKSVRVLREFLIPVNTVNKKPKLSENKPNPKKPSKPKFEVGDRILYRKQKGVVIEVDEQGSYGLELDQGQIVRRATEEMFSLDDSWNSDDFGDIKRQTDSSGQGLIFQDPTEEPPDPDDFDTTAGYDAAYKKWKQSRKSGDNCKQPLTMKDFKVGQFYSDGNSVARLLSKTSKNLILQWVGMGDAPAPKGCEYYPQEGIEVHIESECGKALQSYLFDPFDPPRFVEKKLQKDDLVVPKWNKDTGKGQGRVIGYSDGLVIYQEDSGEEHRLSDEKLVLLSHGGYSVGDRVFKLIPDFPWQPQLEGTITALYSNCCDVEFEGFNEPCRLMYAWLVDVHPGQVSDEKDTSLEISIIVSEISRSSDLSSLEKLIDSKKFQLCWDSLGKDDCLEIIKKIWFNFNRK